LLGVGNQPSHTNDGGAGNAVRNENVEDVIHGGPPPARRSSQGEPVHTGAQRYFVTVCGSCGQT